MGKLNCGFFNVLAICKNPWPVMPPLGGSMILRKIQQAHQRALTPSKFAAVKSGSNQPQPKSNEAPLNHIKGRIKAGAIDQRAKFIGLQENLLGMRKPRCIIAPSLGDGARRF